MRWQVRLLGWILAVLLGGFVLDQLVWTLRGSPMRQVDVKVLTAMELKNHKEDFGTADTQTVRCEVAALPFPGTGGWMAPCWWLRRHREIVRRY